MIREFALAGMLAACAGTGAAFAGNDGGVTGSVTNARDAGAGTAAAGADGGALPRPADPALDARAVVERFCAHSFANGDSLDDARPSAEREHEMLENQTWDFLPFVGQGNPWVVVTGWQIQSVEVEGDRGTAVVRYQRIAKSRDGSSVSYPWWANEDVRLKLQYLEGRWWVIDPPPMHISLEGLIAAYRERLQMDTPEWAAQATATQKASRDEALAVVRELEQLRARVGAKR